MSVDWNPYWVANVPIAAGLVTLAVVIYRARASATENQSLALLLWGLGQMAAGLILAYAAEDGATVQAAYAMIYASWFSVLASQLRFAASLGVPWLALIRRRWVDRALLVAIFAGPIASYAWLVPLTFTSVAPFPPHLPWRPLYTPGGYEAWHSIAAALSFVTLLAAGHAWRREAPGPRRVKLQTYFLAAIAIETTTIASHLIRVHVVGTARSGGALEPWMIPFSLISSSFILAAYVIGLGYAILKAQVFDIDLKIKWGLRRGTLVGAFLSVFVVVSSIVEQWLQQYGVLLGGVAVGIMLLALRPLERAADRLADRAMPHVTDTAEYRTVRKREVYRAAVESALEDGGDITTKERGMLATLQDQLGLSAKDAHDIEREARAVRAPAA